jgi:hypothetical protein
MGMDVRFVSRGLPIPRSVLGKVMSVAFPQTNVSESVPRGGRNYGFPAQKMVL